jgi:hypothetical protein
MVINPWITQQVAEARIRDLRREAALERRGRDAAAPKKARRDRPATAPGIGEG